MASFQLFYEFSLVFGIVITAIILLLLSKKRSQHLHHRLLLAFFVIIISLFLNYYASYHGIYWLFVGTNLITEGAGFLIGPLIYLYITSLFAKINYRAPKIWLYFIPYLLFWLLIPLPLSFKNPNDGFLFDYLSLYFEYSKSFFFIEILYLLLFTLLSLRLWNRYALAIDAYFSSLTATDIIWSKRLLLGITFYLLVEIIFLILGIFKNEYIFFDTPVSVLTILAIVLYLGYNGFFQSQMLIPSFLLEKQLDAIEKPIVANLPKLNSSFSKNEIEHINQAIFTSLEKERLYLNPSLNLSNLAEAVVISDKKLSIFINQELKTNFYELINHYRLESFKEEIALEKNQNLTIWGIANQCGFNSKTSFNRIFKKQTGLTPSQYQKSLKK